MTRQAEAAPETGAGALARLVRAAPERGPLWLRRLRRSALARFEELGLPTAKDEEWKQTSVAPIAGTRFVRADRETSVSRSELERLPLARIGCPRIVLVDGRHAESLSDLRDLPSGVRVGGLLAALEERPEELELYLGRHAGFRDRPFVALNTAGFEDGAVVTLSAGTVTETPIHVLHLAVGGDRSVVSHPRTLVLAGENVQAGLVETYASLGDSAYCNNAVTEIVLGENASLDHCRVQHESEEAFHVGFVQAHQARDSRYVSHNVSYGAALCRLDICGLLDGEGAEATLNGLYLASGSQHVDNHTLLDHAKPHCPSHELYKGILAGRAEAVFNGRIVVRPGAQKTDAKQSNKSLLLSTDALIHTRPQLEIYADDVKCTHGATIGQLDEEALFYVRSRGIEADDARSLLIHGFTSEILERIAHAPLRRCLEEEATRIMARELRRREDG